MTSVHCRSRGTKHCSIPFLYPHASFSLCSTQGHLQCSEMMSRSAGHRAQPVTATCRTPGLRPSQLLIAILLFFCFNFAFAAAAVTEDPRGESGGVSNRFCLSQRAARHNKVWLLIVRWLWPSLTSSSLAILERVTDEGILFFLHV